MLKMLPLFQKQKTFTYLKDLNVWTTRHKERVLQLRTMRDNQFYLAFLKNCSVFASEDKKMLDLGQKIQTYGHTY